jgi:hypothetical protein
MSLLEKETRLAEVAFLLDLPHTSKNDLAALPCLGIFMMTDLAWQLANLVYVPYCSSDAHMGDSDHEVVRIIVIIVHIRELLRTLFVFGQRCFIGSRILPQTGVFRVYIYH